MKFKLFIIVFFVFSSCYFYSQTKTPFVFRYHTKHLTKKFHKHLKYDTIINTSKAKIHLYYSNDAVKPYLLMLHGMGAEAKENWHKQIKTLSKHYNLIVPDLIYFGESTSVENNFSLDFQVTQINEVLERLMISKKINVMGFSYRGLCAAYYNEVFTNKVDKLIIMDGPVKYFSIAAADSLAKIAGADNITNLLAPQTLSDFNSLVKAGVSKKIVITKGIKKKIIKYYFTSNLEFRKQQIKSLVNEEAKLTSINYGIDKTPTLLIWGEKDGIVPFSVAKLLHLNFPNTTKLITYKKAKHDVHFRYPKKINNQVINFLKGG
ncbi:MAG: alpha/beta hydrolase [Bacteroidota bacterium]|nr:alpha/beta hydrolase [Bacteroidota bacterium]